MLVRFLGVILIILILSFFSIKSSKLEFESEYPNLKVNGENALILNENVFTIFSDKFTLDIEAEGYLKRTFEGSHSSGINKIKLEKKPIRIDFSKLIEMPREIIINGEEYNEANAVLKEGINEIYLTFENFLPALSNVLIDTEDYFYFENDLIPVSKKIDVINFSPEDEILVNGKLLKSKGAVTLEKFMNVLEILRENRTIFTEVIFVNNNDDEEILLEKFARKVQLNLKQKDVDIFVNNKFIGNTLSYLENLKDGDSISFVKKKYYREFLEYEGQKSLIIDLIPKKGSLRVKADQNVEAVLFSNKLELTEDPIELIVGDYEITFAAEGFASETKMITINENKLTEVDISLLTVREDAIRRAKRSFKNSIGVNLILNNPGKIIIGSGSEEFRRNKNEIKRKVDIKRHFYLSDSLITNSQFNQIMGTGKSDNLPVTNITWIQAAMFCNKLSKKEGFKPFYIINNEKLLGFDLSSRGYRLPTESEWEYVIGLPDKSGIKQKIYPWGNAEKLDESIANLSDINSGNKNVISNYVDEHKTLSPSDSYPKTASGYYDFLGNAKEWVNDFYSEEISINDTKYMPDYIGPNFGKTHVIKGSSYQSFNLSELGISYRDDSEKGMDDLGFRIARWIY